MRTGKRWCVLISLCFFVGLFVMYAFYQNQQRDETKTPLPGARDKREFRRMVDHYCYRSLLEKVTGSEGVLEGEDSGSYELAQVHMVARHGDRTPVSDFGLKPRVHYRCGVRGRGRLSPDWRVLGRVHPLSLPVNAMVRNADTNLQDLVDARKSKCGLGQLTETGALQHWMLGSFFAKRYPSLAGAPSKDSVFIHSTDYLRTIHSAAAFLVGFLPANASLQQPIPLHISAGTTLAAPPVGIPVHYPTCTRANAVRNKELKATSYLTSAQAKRSSFDRLLQAAGVSKTFNPSFTEMFDQLWTRLCHDLSLPCSSKGCVNYSLALEGARLSHWSFSHSYPQNFSILVSQPYLYHTVVSEMESAIRANLEERTYYRFTFSFSHDSLLTPLLNVLRLPQNEWLPYATRLVFELWRKKEVSSINEKYLYYVRILLNGKSLTSQLTHIDTKHFVLNRELVYHPAWVETIVSGPLRDKVSYKQVCG